MILKLINSFSEIAIFKNVHGFLRSFKSSCFKKMDMNTVYFRLFEDAEQFQVSLHVKNDEYRVDRQFNFNRRLSETVETFLGRISSSIEKTIEKKNKKNKNKNKESQETDDQFKVDIRLLSNNSIITGDVLCKDMINMNNLCIEMLETNYIVVVNSPWVHNLALPRSIMAGFPVYPSKLDLLFSLRSESEFNWLKGNNISEWQCVGNEFFYTPKTDDIGYNLKLECVPKRDGLSGPKTSALCSKPIEAGPGSCPFEQRHLFTNEKLGNGRFRMISYNILADLYADSNTAREQIFPYCPAYAIEVDYRKQLLIKELLGYNADIICLQEVDSKVFNNDLIPVLSTVGFDGVFNKKGGGCINEGLACLFDTKKFRLIKSDIILLMEELQTNHLFSHIWEKIKDNSSLLERIKGKKQSLQVVVLETADGTEKPQRMVVGNTHLYFHPNADHVRLLQIGMSMVYIENIIKEQQSLSPDVTVMVCGDFNSTPEFGLYEFMTTSCVGTDHNDWKSCEDESIKNLSLSHPFSLGSACGTPQYTNFTENFADCLDYIFYQTDALNVTQVVPFPSEEELRQHTALPSVVFPSDHVALIADFQWK